jgi:tetrahydromethanopterin S-methyltransferase subunit A
LAASIKDRAPFGLSIVGTLSTENLGLERLIQNVLANPNIRFLVLCGPDSEQKIGHLPGASLMALFRNGVDGSGKIKEAPGKRPMIKNLGFERIERFRRQVTPVDSIGEQDLGELMGTIERLAAGAPDAFGEPLLPEDQVPVVQARIDAALVLDPKGYFVIDADHRARKIRAEHYWNDGTLECIVEGSEPAEIYMTLIGRELVSRLDHASYLGKELARANEALLFNKPFIQDKAQGNDDACAGKECC